MQERNDQRLIEHGFPCHQVGAETQRERDTGKAPPVNRLHVWWARRPLTPSRAAIVASLAQADMNPEDFVRQLGIEQVQALLHDTVWTLTGNLLDRIECDDGEDERLVVDEQVLRQLQQEDKRRGQNRALIAELRAKDASLAKDPVLLRWEAESQPLSLPWPKEGEHLAVRRVMGDPAWAKQRITWETAHKLRTAEDKYGYGRAFINSPSGGPTQLTILDPTAGGGSIPFEALRLGHRVIANEINPVATAILYATLDYPARFGLELAEDIEQWGQKLRDGMLKVMGDLFPASPLDEMQKVELQRHLRRCPEVLTDFENEKETLDGFIYTRQVTCPHCLGEAPLLNTCWLSKDAGDPWGVRIVTDGQSRGGKVSFQTYRVVKGRGPNGEDPNQATVNRGIGQCVHCKQAISGDAIKTQARGESPHGPWTDRLYCVVAVRLEPKLDPHGKPQRYASGARKGEIKTRKVRFFRSPNARDLQALQDAEARLHEKWSAWEEAGLIPTEGFPEGNDTRPIKYGMPRWCDLFTPRQLLGHLTLIEGLNHLKPQILDELGLDRGRAVVTYLQFAIDKGLDYNSKQTRWIPQRGIVSGTFSRHDFSVKWTFGEMIFSGPHSGVAWGLSQVMDAYQGIAGLVEPLNRASIAADTSLPLTILKGTAAHMPSISDQSVDLVCMDPPYYDNVQYGELSDYFYVWQRRTLADLYPGVFNRRLVNKTDEAVANPARDGSTKAAKVSYEQKMQEIFAECKRVLKDDGVMTLMFTHKSQDAWEALTQSLIEAGWTITASFPVESEFTASMHQKDMAAAASSIFIACRKRTAEQPFPAVWTGLGDQGVQHRIRAAVEKALDEFALLNLYPVDEMVEMAAKFLLPFGRAMRGASARHAYLLPIEEERLAPSIYDPDLVIVSTGLLVRKERRRDLAAAPPFDITLVDEAHYARRKNPTQGSRAEARYGNLYTVLLHSLRPKSRSLLLATATPMQLDLVEVADLLQLTRRVGAFQLDPSLMEVYYDLLGKLVRGQRLSEREWTFLRRSVSAVQDQDPVRWGFIHDAVIDARNWKLIAPDWPSRWPGEAAQVTRARWSISRSPNRPTGDNRPRGGEAPVFAAAD